MKPIERRTSLALCAAAATPFAASAQTTLPRRPIPGTKETLPVIGLGSSKGVSAIAAGPGPLTEVLKTLVAHGGSVVDTWPRVPADDVAFGKVLALPELKSLFVTTKVDKPGKEAGLAQIRDSLKAYGRKTIDLAQIFSLTDLDTHWPTLKDLKAKGEARYIGVTVSDYGKFDPLVDFLAREKPDVVQLNYSITERKAEDRLLPLLQDRGIAVIINRPFMNGSYFEKLANKPVPAWAADLGCTSWADVSLKYILANPAVTCVLTETTNPKHMAENARAAAGKLPDASARTRMIAAIESA